MPNSAKQLNSGFCLKNQVYKVVILNLGCKLKPPREILKSLAVQAVHQRSGVGTQ